MASIFKQSDGAGCPQPHGQSHQWCCNPLGLASSPGTHTNTHRQSHTPRTGCDGRGGKVEKGKVKTTSELQAQT